MNDCDRKNLHSLNEGLLQQQLILDGITQEDLRQKRSELTRHLQPQMDEIEKLIAQLDEKICSIHGKKDSDDSKKIDLEAQNADLSQEEALKMIEEHIQSIGKVFQDYCSNWNRQSIMFATEKSVSSIFMLCFVCFYFCFEQRNA